MLGHVFQNLGLSFTRGVGATLSNDDHAEAPNSEAYVPGHAVPILYVLSKTGGRLALKGESAALPLEELEKAVVYLNATKSKRSHPAAISWEVVEQCLNDAGFRDAVSFRRLCQCLLQSEVLARRLHTPPLPMRRMDRVAAILAPPPKPSVPETTEEEPIAEEKPPPRKQRSLRKKVNSTMRLALAARKRENAERAAAAAAGAGGGADEE